MDSIFGNIKKMNKNEGSIINQKKDKEIILKNYNFDYDIDEETREFLKETTFKLHNVTHKFYTDIGKMLFEAQEKLANNKNGVFTMWCENIGIKKNNAYRYINRYKYIVAIRNDMIVEKVEALPFSLSTEIAKESCPETVRKKVINGEISTIKDFRNELKAAKQDLNTIEEAEIVDEFNYAEQVQIKVEVVKNSLNKIEKEIIRNKENYEILKKIEKLLRKMK